MSKLMREMTLPRKQSSNIQTKGGRKEEETRNCVNIIQSRGREHIINHRGLVESEPKIKRREIKRRDGIKSYK